jgi:hypothetical protein
MKKLAISAAIVAAALLSTGDQAQAGRGLFSAGSYGSAGSSGGSTNFALRNVLLAKPHRTVPVVEPHTVQQGVQADPMVHSARQDQADPVVDRMAALQIVNCVPHENLRPTVQVAARLRMADLLGLLFIMHQLLRMVAAMDIIPQLRQRHQLTALLLFDQLPPLSSNSPTLSSACRRMRPCILAATRQLMPVRFASSRFQ